MCHTQRTPTQLNASVLKSMSSKCPCRAAGKETGCKFFLLFHTGFVKDDGALPVPLAMMDKAFKNKKGKYRNDGLATLRFALMTDEAATRCQRTQEKV